MSNLNEQKDKNLGKTYGSTLKNLVSFMITTCFSRINTLNSGKSEQLRDSIKTMLSIEEERYKGQRERYDDLRNTVDLFFSYISQEKVTNLIKSGTISKIDFEEKFLSTVMGIPKRKYDMQDLYRPDLLASVSRGDSRKKVRVLLSNKAPAYTYEDDEGRTIIITDVGSIAYEEWGGLKSDISMYMIQKNREDGTFSNDLICSKIIIPEMEDFRYRRAVLGELLSDENISRSNVGGYIGQISRRKKSDQRDLPRTERQSTDEYTYRIDDEYVLEYDATELTAVVEAVRQYGNQERGSSSIFGKNIGGNDRKRLHSETDDYDGHDGR